MAPHASSLAFLGDDAVSLRPYLLAIGLLLAPVYWISTAIYNLYFHPLSKVPGPKLWSISPLAYAWWECTGYCHEKILELHQTYGGVVRTGPDSVSLSDPNAWKDVFGHRKAGKLENAKDPTFYSDMPQSVIGTESPEDHGRQRRILSRGFSAQIMVKQEPLIRRHIDRLFQRMHEYADRGEPIDVVDWYNYTTFDVIGDLTFGSPFGCLESASYHSWVAMIFDGVRQKHYLRQIRRASPTFYALLDPILKRLVAPIAREARDLTETRVHQRLSLGSERPDFMQSMIGEEGEKKMTMPELYDNADILILAGSETTATALSGITSILCTHPHILSKLRDEIDTSFNSEEEITLITVQKLKYMMDVIDEGLRLYPAAPGTVPRMINPMGETVSGIYLPGKTMAHVWHWSTYHNPNNFALPKSFIPERWDGTDPRCANDRKDAFQPFSHGGRNCLGKNLGYAEMRLILARLIWDFDFELADPKDKDWVFGQRMYGLWEKPSLKIRLSRRNKGN